MYSALGGILLSIIGVICAGLFRRYLALVLAAELGFVIFLIIGMHNGSLLEALVYSGAGAYSMALLCAVLLSSRRLGLTSDIDHIAKNSAQVTVATFAAITFMTIIATWKQNPHPLEIVTGGLVGLIGAVVTLVGLQVYVFTERLDKVGRAVGSADEKIASANKIISAGAATLKDELAGTATATMRALESVLDVRKAFEAAAPASSAAAVLPGLEAMGLSYEAWARRLKSQDPYEAKVWLAACPTYYREEAFDVNHGEIVTNGRNFCFLLLATLSELLDQSDGNTVVYYQVTPVHPKDWYNWPHGFGRPHFYFENEFIGLYHRSLAALIQWSKTASKSIEHGRFVLSRAATSRSKIVPFGWDLPGSFGAGEKNPGSAGEKESPPGR
jgi:hypothetical protein